ncbi:MAG: DUF465 domain-containing protein [Alphaproteobacteria bacterium]
MAHPHLRALKKKHEKLEHDLQKELAHPARDEGAIKKMKATRLHLREEIEALETR